MWIDFAHRTGAKPRQPLSRPRKGNLRKKSVQRTEVSPLLTPHALHAAPRRPAGARAGATEANFWLGTDAMPRRLLPLSTTRDAMLVLATILFALLLGTVAPELPSSDTPGAATFGSAGVRLGSGSGLPRSVAMTAAAALGRTERDRAISASDCPRPAPATVLESPRPGEHFSGNGGGRKETVIIQDLHNRRAYLIETTSLMHRRGWIGVASRIDPPSSGPSLQRGPR